jgi:hypothetical protein
MAVMRCSCSGDWMMAGRLLLSVLFLLALGGCWGLDVSEIDGGVYLITGYLLKANASTLTHEANRVCPNGYDRQSERSGRVAEGPTLEWRIRCHGP